MATAYIRSAAKAHWYSALGAGAVCAAFIMASPFCHAEAPKTERLVHRYLSVALSPDGTRVASVEGDSPASGGLPTVRDLVIRRVDSGAATTVALPCGHDPECWAGSPAWSPDGKHLVFTLRTPGSHARSVYSVEPQGTGLSRLLEFGGTIVDLRYGPAGELALLATEHARKEIGAVEAGAPINGDLNDAPPEQRIAILRDGSLHWASPPELFVYEFDWIPDGHGFVATAAPGDGDEHWWVAKLYVFSPDGGPGQVLYQPTSVRQQLAAPRVSPDGRAVVFIGGIMSDFGSTGGDVYEVPLVGGPAVNLTPRMSASATSLGWSCDGRLRAEMIVGGEEQIVDLGERRSSIAPEVLWRGAETLRGRDAGVSIACPGSQMATIHESFIQPPEIETGTLGNWHELTHVNAGLTMPVRIENLAWKSDSASVQGWLLLPLSGDGPFPLVTVVHGGPASAALPRFGGPGLQLSLLEGGYAILLPNPRGSFGQGEKFALANVRDFGHGDLRDILAGVDAAERAASIDDKRLAITGGSYGGFMTMWAVTQTHRFKAAIAAAGISDWVSYYGENGINAWLLPYFGASVYGDPRVYARSSPINFVRNVRTPTFAYAGEYDIECPPGQTREFWHALRELGIPTDSVIYPGEGHGLRDPAHGADADRRTLDWLTKYLR